MKRLGPISLQSLLIFLFHYKFFLTAASLPFAPTTKISGCDYKRCGLVLLDLVTLVDVTGVTFSLQKSQTEHTPNRAMRSARVRAITNARMPTYNATHTIRDALTTCMHAHNNICRYARARQHADKDKRADTQSVMQASMHATHARTPTPLPLTP
jgi:hypothetical protein